MLVVNTSLASINAERKLTATSRSMGVAMERLSSGLRINGAKDDAAGLSISTGMTAQIRGVQKSIQNSTDWISLFQTAEGGLNEMSNILQRVRELSVQSLNGTNNDSDRASLNAEVQELVEELDRIATTTQFNGISVLNGDLQNSYMQLGANSSENTAVSFQKMDAENLGRGVYAGPEESPGVDTTQRFNNLTFKFRDQAFNIRSTDDSDDLVSTSLASNSAIAKANAINSSVDLEGFKVEAYNTKFVSNDVINAATLDTNTYLEINDVKISGFAVIDYDADGALTSAINAESEETGVVASVDAEGQLVLTAKDGRNIEFSVVGFGGAFAGEADNRTSVTGGNVRVRSNEGFVFNNNIVGAKGNDHALGGNSTLDVVFVNKGKETTVSSYDISTEYGAQRTLDIIGFAIDDVNEMRADFGAL
jgi:flagellin